jgi:hypothetical protein
VCLVFLSLCFFVCIYTQTQTHTPSHHPIAHGIDVHKGPAERHSDSCEQQNWIFFGTTHTSAYVSIRQQNATVIVASHRTTNFVCPPAAACHRDRHIICRIILRTHISVWVRIWTSIFVHTLLCRESTFTYLFICLL